MKQMPSTLKTKLRRLQDVYMKARILEKEVNEIIESYGVDLDCLCACNTDDMNTEALAYISYGEGNIEDNIRSIEEVFLYYVNKNKSENIKEE